ncbi:MAG: YihY/virulence factor BrkB family protein [Coriobacteriales bacterium]|nr:YihY/virulence factor BrkB family protein [Coriobacteriales bacterium]
MREAWYKARGLWAEFSKARAGTHASSISYYSFLSLVPLLIICISLVSMTSVSQSETTEFFCSIAPDTFDGLIQTLVGEAYAQSGLAFSLSAITLIWSASKGVRAIGVGLNAVYAEEETRGSIRVIIMSMIAAVIMMALLAAVIYLVFSGSVLRALAGFVPGMQEQDTVVSWLNSGATLALGVLALTACYTFLPSGRRRFLAQLPGALCAALAAGLLSFGFRIYVDYFCNYAVLYGSIATIALLLFWMYLLFYVLLACGFINHLLAKRAELKRHG